MKGKFIGWTAAGLAGVGVFAGVATTASAATNTVGATSTSSAATTLTAAHTGLSQKALTRAERKLARGAARGEVVLDTKKGVTTVDFQRGTTSGASDTAITVTDATGTAQTWAISSATKVRERGVSSPQLTDDENVVVIGVKSDGTLTTRLIVVVPARAAQPTA
jgi:hypothetical protein